ncbi:SH3 domain-containing protein [Arhodomonas sp. AD133]|uniref:SH3 domain-containing protein n=1 Tax=Arhodomonas sp. AD133 TaxID=3415009 RepID=UPI003EB7D300
MRYAALPLIAGCLLAPATFAGDDARAGYSSPYLVDTPSASGDRQRRLDPGERVTITDRDGSWVEVRTRGGDSGWVRASQLRDD